MRGKRKVKGNESKKENGKEIRNANQKEKRKNNKEVQKGEGARGGTGRTNKSTSQAVNLN